MSEVECKPAMGLLKRERRATLHPSLRKPGPGKAELPEQGHRPCCPFAAGRCNYARMHARIANGQCAWRSKSSLRSCTTADSLSIWRSGISWSPCRKTAMTRSSQRFEKRASRGSRLHSCSGWMQAPNLTWRRYATKSMKISLPTSTIVTTWGHLALPHDPKAVADFNAKMSELGRAKLDIPTRHLEKLPGRFAPFLTLTDFWR